MKNKDDIIKQVGLLGIIVNFILLWNKGIIYVLKFLSCPTLKSL